MLPPPPHLRNASSSKRNQQLTSSGSIEKSFHAGSKSAVKSALIAASLILSFGLTNAHACNYIEGAGVLFNNGQSNVVQAQYNPNLGQWELVDYWYDPEADTYVPQSDDIVITDANGNIDIIYINTTNGVNNVDGSENLSPLAQPANDGIDDKSSNSRGRGEADLSCLNDPPADGVTDRILVIGQSFHNFSWFSYIAFGRGGPSSGGGGGGGSNNQSGNVLPRYPYADDTINCSSVGEMRTQYAGANVNYMRGITGTQGNLYNGNPKPLSSYTVEYANGQKESYRAGPYGSPTTAGGNPIPGTCY